MYLEDKDTAHYLLIGHQSSRNIVCITNNDYFSNNYFRCKLDFCCCYKIQFMESQNCFFLKNYEKKWNAIINCDLRLICQCDERLLDVLQSTVQSFVLSKFN